MAAERAPSTAPRRPAGLPGLRAVREAKLLTQEELAEQSGVNPATISGLEGGKQTARFRTIRQLAAALGVEPEQLLEAPRQRLRRGRPVHLGTQAARAKEKEQES